MTQYLDALEEGQTRNLTLFVAAIWTDWTANRVNVVLAILTTGCVLIAAAFFIIFGLRKYLSQYELAYCKKQPGLGWLFLLVLLLDVIMTQIMRSRQSTYYAFFVAAIMLGCVYWPTRRVIATLKQAGAEHNVVLRLKVAFGVLACGIATIVCSIILAIR